MEKTKTTYVDFNALETEISLVKNVQHKNLVSKGSIIYLPGFGCDFTHHSSFKDLLVAYDYYAINFPAHGNSSWKQPNELTLNYFANIVVNFISKYQLKNIILIGHSSAALVVAIVNKLIPEKIIANVLVSPIDASWQLDVNQVTDIILPRVPEANEQLQRLKIFNYELIKNEKYWIKDTQRQLDNFNKNAKGLSIIINSLLSNELKSTMDKLYQSIKIPTLIVFGNHDGVLRVQEVNKKMYSLLPKSSAIFIPLAGHEPFLENPNNYFINIINFIDSIIEKNI